MSNTASGQCTAVPAGSSVPSGFEFERFDVYRVALEFQKLVPQLVPRRGYAALRDQLDRASASILLNVAEGAGRFARADKANFYLIARDAGVTADPNAPRACSLIWRDISPRAYVKHTEPLQ